MTKLTTHVLDIYSGKPGKGIKVDLYFIQKSEKKKLKSIVLNNDGRSDQPLIENDEFKIGKYELIFFVGDYFKDITKNNDLQFLDDVVVRFGISNNKEHYHVPLLVSPWSYSTYRGS
jgi:5-hydroxyisourate hydrolase